ncbi:hypothetical protein HO173_009996 [Letharia columbiana]|uniref:Uncharacterized protein n=1 Tax=Letharia columbiana TaxID=112416 RepID=A0A8H6FNC5_9LECA|nr:uncharacterized protein HO173_009996 [Letharia columbiana]KAF6231694.1 hypothetical protein HO173_009996 [Letharia columbiana]
MTTIFYILYNADASVMGKLNYGYRKLTSPKDKPACSACDITHGGLHFEETAAWKEAKVTLVKEGHVEIRQMHRDELTSEIKSFVQEKKLSYPMILAGEGEGNLRVVMDRQELGECGGNAQQLAAKLREKGVVSSSHSSL